MPHLYIIGGCNGAGKTTASFTVLPEILNCKEFVNADEIARGLSPFQPETVSFQAGRIMLHRINELIAEKVDFAFETTLSTKSYRLLIQKAQEIGYTVTLVFFWLESPILAEERVKIRVEKGGHHIPSEIVKRRYYRGLQNLSAIYLRAVNSWMIYNNSCANPDLIAKGENKEIVVYNSDIWKFISV